VTLHWVYAIFNVTPYESRQKTVPVLTAHPLTVGNMPKRTMKRVFLLGTIGLIAFIKGFSQEDCIFDQATQTDEFLKGIPELENYSWNQETKTATIVFPNQDTLLVQRGGCDHFGVSAEFILRNDPADFRNWDNVFDKVLWIAEILDNEFNFERLRDDLKSNKLEIVRINSADEVIFSDEYLQINHYELIRFIDQKKTIIFLSFYIN
jgi:hypothetical protein